MTAEARGGRGPSLARAGDGPRGGEAVRRGLPVRPPHAPTPCPHTAHGAQTPLAWQCTPLFFALPCPSFHSPPPLPPPINCPLITAHPSLAPQVLDRNTVKLVAGEYDLLVVDKENEGPTAVRGGALAACQG